MKTIFTLLLVLLATAGFAGNGKLIISKEKNFVNLSWTAEVGEGFFIVERENDKGEWKQIALVFPAEGIRTYFVKDTDSKKAVSYKISHVHNNETSVFAESIQPVKNVSAIKVEKLNNQLFLNSSSINMAPDAEVYTSEGILVYKSKAKTASGKYLIEIPESVKGRMILRIIEDDKNSLVRNFTF